MRKLISTLIGAAIGEAGWIAWVIYRDVELHPGRLYVPETTAGVIIYYASVGIPAALVAANAGFLFGRLWEWLMPASRP